VAFLLFALVAAVTPGPSNIMLTAAGAQVGVWRGVPCLLGVTLGTGLMLFLVPLGLGSLVLGHPAVLAALRWAGSGFLLWLAWKIATAPGRVDATQDDGHVGFLDAAMLQWINPKSWLVSASAASTFLDAQAGSAVVQAIALAILFVVAATPGCFVWLAFGATVQRVLGTERRRRVFNVAMGALLALSVVLIVR
jgi:threonine/homoserine/homoserine lactone efflux protein